MLIFDLLHAQPIGDTKYHGGGAYIKIIFEKLIKKTHLANKIIAFYDFDSFLDDNIIQLIRKYKIISIDIKRIEDLKTKIFQNIKDDNVCFFSGMPYTYCDYVFPDNVYTIGTCHGLRQLEIHPDMCSLRYSSSLGAIKRILLYPFTSRRHQEDTRQMYKNILQKFNLIITDSEFSKYSIKNFFPEIDVNSKVKVFYPPQEGDGCCLQCDDKNYILMLSGNRWEKNSYRGLMAIDQLISENQISCEVYITGSLSKNILKSVKNIQKIHVLGYISNEELQNLEKNCKLLFYPTLNEGFGYPPQDAMKYMKTCLVSAVCSLPEIYRDSVYYCNPYDIQEMKNRILQALQCPIPKSTIEENYNRIVKKQEQDVNNFFSILESKI